MSIRKVKFAANTYISKCPNCGNNTIFVVHSEQVAEDLCDIWAVCGICAYDPTSNNALNRLEDVWGGVDDDNVKDAINFTWNDLIDT